MTSATEIALVGLIVTAIAQQVTIVHLFVAVGDLRRGAPQGVAEPRFGHPIGPWHRWFAWRPVRTVDQGLVWMRTVSRRRYQSLPNLPGATYDWFHHAVAANPITNGDR